MLNISEATMHHDLDWLKTHGFLEHVHNRWAVPTRQGAWEFTRCL
jgi:DeoR/GlpR family transcriptional regulator of sugar metabolism